MQRWEYCSLKHTDYGLVFTYYQTASIYDQPTNDPEFTHTTNILHQDPNDTSYFDAYQQQIAHLGMNRWEAIAVTPSDSGYENWYFKRAV